jgi:hypothetical protein
MVAPGGHVIILSISTGQDTCFPKQPGAAIGVRPNSILHDQMRREIAMPIDMDSIKDQEVVLWDNSVIRLSRFWEEGPLVLVFLRHYG